MITIINDIIIISTLFLKAFSPDGTLLLPERTPTSRPPAAGKTQKTFVLFLPRRQETFCKWIIILFHSFQCGLVVVFTLPLVCWLLTEI